MSSENAEIVQGWLDALRSRADEAAFQYLDPEIQIDWSQSDGPASGIYSGHDESRKLFDEYQDAFEEFWIEPEELISAGPHVVVPNTSHFRSRDGLEVIARGTLVFTVGEGKIVAVRLFQDRGEALLAAGLEE